MKYNEVNEFYNVFDGDENLSEYIFDNVLRRVLYDIFRNQHEVVYMAGEKGKYPVMKEDAISTIRKIVISNLGFTISELTYITADLLYRGIVNPGEAEWQLKKRFGQEYPNWEDIYPDKIPYEEYEMKGKISARPAYGEWK